MSTTYDALFKGAELGQGLPAGVLKAVAVQESNLDTWASRYEPDFFVRYIVPMKDVQTFGASRPTELRHRATSWGLLQIMGQVAREQGATFAHLDMLCDPVFGISYGARHLGKQFKRYDGDLAKALAAYNAGSFPPAVDNYDSYVKPILDRMAV